MTKKENRCWPGYEPVAGKEQHEQGSCRKKAASKLSPSEKQFRARREKQLDEWQTAHKGKPRRAAQHLSAPGEKKGMAQKRSPAKTKAPSKKNA